MPIDDLPEGIPDYAVPLHVYRSMPTQGPTSRYTPQMRMNAALVWSTSGNSAETARKLGIPEQIVRYWTYQPWFELALSECYKRRRRSIDAALSGVIERSLSETMDRLVNGDVVIHQGVRMRVPVKAKDAMLIATLAVDKQRLLRGEATSRVERVSLGDIRKQLGQIIEGESPSYQIEDDSKQQNIEETEG